MRELGLKPKLFVGLVAVLGILVEIQALLQWHSDDKARFVVYLLFSILVSRLKVKLPGIDGSMSVGFLFILISIVDLGFGEAILLASISTFLQSVWHVEKRPQAIHVVFNVTSIALATAAAFTSYHSLVDWGINRMVLLAVAAFTYFVLNTVPVSLVISMTEKKSVKKIFSECYFWSFPYYMVGASIAGLCSWLSHQVGWESALLMLPVIYLIYRSYFLYLEKLSDEKRRVEEEKKHVQEMASLHMRTIEALALAIEAKDTTTHDHLQRVRIYALELGKLLNITQSEMDALRAAALLHDIGKLGVPEHIISKPGKLTTEEFEKMKIHPIVGAEILERVRFPYPVAPIVRAHHEKWDGSGYPDGLREEQIPIGARILSAVDCLDALASDRQYRRALPLDKAMEMVVNESGKAFDPKIVRVLWQHYIDLEKIVLEQAQVIGGSPLSVDAHVEAGAAPDAGFEHPAVTAPEVDFISCIASARQEAQTLYELSQDLGSSLRLDDTLSLLTTRLRRLVPFDTIAVFLREEQNLTPAFTSGDNYRVISSLKIPVGDGLVGWVAANRKPIINGNPGVEHGYTSQDPNALQSALALPLEAAEGVIGVLCLYRRDKDAFSKEDVRLLLAISSRVALSIENAVKFEQAETSSATDYLTGLPNARSLFVHLHREITRCERESKSVAVMVCDLDGFKQVNDRFGHLDGNRVLKMFADELAAICREYDYVARMGGDEFVVIIPGLTPDAAGDRTRVIDQIARTIGKKLTNEPLLSASIGQAFFPIDGTDPEALLAEADRRMYAAKQTRRRVRNAEIEAASAETQTLPAYR